MHDAHFKCGKPHRVAFGAAEANTRYSVSEDGERRVFTFKRGDSRALDVTTLSIRLGGAGWVSAQVFDSSKR